MTDKRIKEDCPYCGEPANNIQIKTFQEGKNKIYCPSCKATFDFIGSKQELINMWNRRFR